MWISYQFTPDYFSLVNTPYYSAYKGYHNSIVNCCYLSQYGSNVTARIECAKGKISTYSGNNVTIQANYWKTKMPTVIKQKVCLA
jgi:hypothetical protein